MKTAIEIMFYGVLLFASVAVWTTTSTFVDDEDAVAAWNRRAGKGETK